jgi:hypothetical protein
MGEYWEAHFPFNKKENYQGIFVSIKIFKSILEQQNQRA